jgi:2-phospho-L-lactate transferase/gluconeogenesis factor (CofD/UPF0052 family)
MSGPRIVLLSGGSAARSLTMELARRDVGVTRIVPAWDSGGSSKVIREALGLMPVGDIRQALLTMASGEGRSDALVRLCNTRLSDAHPAAARAEFSMVVSGEHPLLAEIDSAARAAVMADLASFAEAVGDGFDCLNGSIGNFILAGAMLRRDGDGEAAIRAFRDLCGIRDHVWPTTLAHNVQLGARLRDGLMISGQHRITGLDRMLGAAGIAEVHFEGAVPEAHAAVTEAIAEADIIVYGPGSFFTSLLPHLMVTGIAGAIVANARARKIFIANLVECNETRGRSLDELLESFVATGLAAARNGATEGVEIDVRALVGRILMDRQPFPAGKTVSGHAYLAPGRVEAWARARGILVQAGSFEDVWQRGRHDGAALADAVLTERL